MKNHNWRIFNIPKDVAGAASFCGNLEPISTGGNVDYVKFIFTPIARTDVKSARAFLTPPEWLDFWELRQKVFVALGLPPDHPLT